MGRMGGSVTSCTGKSSMSTKYVIEKKQKNNYSYYYALGLAFSLLLMIVALENF